MSLRDEPFGTVLAHLYNNEEILIINRQGDWYEIESDKGSGWIYGKCVFDSPNTKPSGSASDTAYISNDTSDDTNKSNGTYNYYSFTEPGDYTLHINSTNKLIKFSADGKALAQLQDPDYGQLFRIEVGAGGHLFVADKGTRKIYIYDSKGDYVNDLNWEWSGMAVTGKEDNLYRLIYFNEENRNMLVKTDLNGNVISSKVIEIELSDPELWWVDEAKGEAVITYNPLEGFEGDYNIIRVNLEGKVIASGKVPAPFVMNRFIDHADYEQFFIGKCNYSEAPNGNFEIIPFKMQR